MKKIFPFFCLFILLTSQTLAGTKWEVRVDERIEVLTIMQYLAGWQVQTGMDKEQYDTRYHWRIKERFNKYKYHPSVRLLKKLYTKGSFWWDAPPNFVYHLGELPDLDFKYPLTEDLLRRIGGQKNAEKFQKALKKFAQDTDFHSFFVENQDYYGRVRKYFMDQIQDPSKYFEFLDTFAGNSRREYVITLSTVFPYNNYAGRIETKDGLIAFNTTAPSLSTGLVDDMVVARYQKKNIIRLLLHEFGHSIVNPANEQNLDALNKSECLFAPIGENMKKMAYPRWEYCTNEHLVRAEVALYFSLYEGEESAERELKYQEKIGFVYIRDFYKLLQEYWKNRETYKSFENYYPQITAGLSAMATSCR